MQKGMIYCGKRDPRKREVAYGHVGGQVGPVWPQLELRNSSTFFASPTSTRSDNYSLLGIMPSTYKKEKPWDTDDIDKWNVGLSDIARIVHQR